MLDIKWIRENPEALDRALANRRAEPQSARLIALDEARRAAIVRLEEAQARRNAASKDIGKAKAAKDEATASKLMAEVATLKDTMGEFEAQSKAAEKALDDALAIIPNVPLPDVPVGADEHGNVEYRRFGKPPTIASPKEHYELGEALGGMDFEAAAKLSGSRFVVLKKGIARLERALGQFMLDLHTEEHGYTEIQPPLLVRGAANFGTGQLPKFESDLFYALSFLIPKDVQRRVEELRLSISEVEENRGELSANTRDLFSTIEKKLNESGAVDQQLFEIVRKAFGAVEAQVDMNVLLAKFYREKLIEAASPLESRLWLIPTAEVPLTNLVRESILSEEELPLRFTALTPCFRSEAGAAGKDTRGMLRQHQFDKVELVSITTPEQSRDEHERMLSCAEEVLKRLNLHYRVMTLSTGDMGFAAQKTYDIEVWLPGQGTFREISSCSACGDFQARRMQARYKPKEGKGNRLVNTLNGSGVAVGRALIAVMENYQNPDGSIAVPDALRRYMGGVEKISA
jgi:seryl-tRNA synthetase